MRTYKLKKCKRVHGLHFTPDGKRLLAVGGEEVRMVDCAVWLDLATGENADRIEQFANCYAVDPALTRYVLGGANCWTSRLTSVQWTLLRAGIEWRSFQSRTRKTPPSFREVVGLAFDATGTRLAIGHAQRANRRSDPNGRRAITIVERNSGETLVHVETFIEAGVMAFNSDGTRLAGTGGMDGPTLAEVYDLDGPRRVFFFESPGSITRCVLFLPDNRLVVANGRNVYVLPPDGGKLQFALAGHPKQVNAVALTPDGRRLLTASHDGSIRTWDANTGAPGPAFEWGIGAVTAVAFAPDGLTCAAAGLNGKVVVWDMDG
jgi:WD40 repeat protein